MKSSLQSHKRDQKLNSRRLRGSALGKTSLLFPRVASLINGCLSALRELEVSTRPKGVAEPISPITESGWIGLMALLGIVAGFVYAALTLP